MELAAAQGFDVRVVTLPPGLDPADVADGFEERLAAAESYLAYRVRLEIERAPRPAGGVRARARGARARSRTRPSARRRCGSRPTGSTCRRRRRPGSPRRRAAPQPAPSRRSCSTRATASSETRSPACVAHPGLLRVLARARAGALRRRRAPAPASSICSAPRRTPTTELVQLLAELDARAAAEGIDERDGRAAAPPPARAAPARVSSRRPTRRACPTSSRRSRRCEPRVSRVRVMRRPIGGYNAARRSPVAQLAEHPAVNRRVVGSSPTRGVQGSWLCGNPHSSMGQTCRECRECTRGAYPGAYLGSANERTKREAGRSPAEGSAARPRVGRTDRLEGRSRCGYQR